MIMFRQKLQREWGEWETKNHEKLLHLTFHMKIIPDMPESGKRERCESFKSFINTPRTSASHLLTPVSGGSNRAPEKEERTRQK